MARLERSDDRAGTDPDVTADTAAPRAVAPERGPDFCSRVLEQVPASLLLLDLDATIIDATDGYLAATMTSREQLVGRHMFDAFPDNPDDPDATGMRNVAASIDRVQATGLPDAMAVQKYDVRRPASEGGGFEERYWSTVNSPVLAADGELLAIVHRVDDVTELVRLRGATAARVGVDATASTTTPTRLEERLFLRGEEEGRANDRLMEVDRMRSEFLANVSHELRTPLNAVIGFAQVLAMDDLDDHQADAVRNIQRSGRHLLDLIDDVLEIAHIEVGRLALSIEPVEVRELVESAVEMVAPLAASGSVTLAVEPIDDDLMAVADRQRALQVLLNLLSNAIKYNRPGGRVDVRATSADGRVRLFVADGGDGIREADRDRLFTPFDRLGKEQTHIEGSGIGLALARGLAEQMGGAVDLHRSGPEGSVFVFELASTTRTEIRAEDTSAVHHLGGDATHPPRPITVLCIEDNLANLRLVEAVLARLPDLTLLTAMQGSIGLDLAVEHRPDLVLLDKHLPDLDGDEVLARLRAHPATGGIPVVMLSADATREGIEQFLSSGGAGYLIKPIDIGELLTTVDAARPA